MAFFAAGPFDPKHKIPKNQWEKLNRFYYCQISILFFLKRPTFVELILDPSNVFLQFPKDFPTYKISNYFRIEFPKNCTLEN